MSIISMKEALESDKDKTILIDLRDVNKYKAGHIPGAIWMDENAIRKNITALKRYSKVMMYCDYGNYGFSLTIKLKKEYGMTNIYNIVGGYNVYRGKIKKG